MLHLQVLHTFHGLRPRTPGSAPCWPLSGEIFTTRQASLYAADQRVALPYRACPRKLWELDPGVDAQSLPPRRRGSPRTPAGCYKGGLVPPLAGLSPASLRELPGRTVRQIFVLVAGQYPSAADQAAGVHLCRQNTATLGVSMFTPPHVIPAKPAPAQAGGRNPEAPRL